MRTGTEPARAFAARKWRLLRILILKRFKSSSCVLSASAVTGAIGFVQTTMSRVKTAGRRVSERETPRFQ